MSQLPVGDYGVLASLVTVMMGTFLWFVRAARADLNRVQERFTTYLQETAAKQTEAMVAMAAGLQKQIEQSRQHETRSQRRQEQIDEQARLAEERNQQRHEQLVARMAGIERDRRQISAMLGDIVHEVAANESAALKEGRDATERTGMD